MTARKAAIIAAEPALRQSLPTQNDAAIDVGKALDASAPFHCPQVSLDKGLAFEFDFHEQLHNPWLIDN